MNLTSFTFHLLKRLTTSPLRFSFPSRLLYVLWLAIHAMTSLEENVWIAALREFGRFYVIPFRSPSVTCWVSCDGYFRVAFWLVGSLWGTPATLCCKSSCVSYHEESLVVVFTGSLANITLQVRPEEREHQAAASKVWLCFFFFIIISVIQRLVQGAVRIANGYIVILFLHGLARELAFD